MAAAAIQAASAAPVVAANSITDGSGPSRLDTSALSCPGTARICLLISWMVVMGCSFGLRISIVEMPPPAISPSPK